MDQSQKCLGTCRLSNSPVKCLDFLVLAERVSFRTTFGSGFFSLSESEWSFAFGFGAAAAFVFFTGAFVGVFFVGVFFVGVFFVGVFLLGGGGGGRGGGGGGGGIDSALDSESESLKYYLSN